MTSDAGDVRPTLDATLRRAATYVATFEQTFTGVLWHERYQQDVRLARRAAASGASILSVVDRRTLESELFFAWLPQDATWIAVRDVITVDGIARPLASRRFPALAARGSMSVLELRDLAAENGRFNIGNIVRTFNEPTLALLVLDERHAPRVVFSRKGHTRLQDRQVVTYGFEERGRPTLIQNARRDMPMRGTLEIDEASGAVWKTTIEIADAADGLRGRMTVDYRRHVAFDVLVPHEMRERYDRGEAEQVETTATYSDYRRFQTTGRLIPPVW